MTELPAAGVGACAAAGAGGDLYIVIGRAPTASQFVAEQLRASLSVAQVHCTMEKRNNRSVAFCSVAQAPDLQTASLSGNRRIASPRPAAKICHP